MHKFCKFLLLLMLVTMAIAMPDAYNRDRRSPEPHKQIQKGYGRGPPRPPGPPGHPGPPGPPGPGLYGGNNGPIRGFGGAGSNSQAQAQATGNSGYGGSNSFASASASASVSVIG